MPQTHRLAYLLARRCFRILTHDGRRYVHWLVALVDLGCGVGAENGHVGFLLLFVMLAIGQVDELEGLDKGLVGLLQ